MGHENRLLEHQLAPQTTGAAVAWLRETSPDVVCLQETKCTDEQFPADALRAAGLRGGFHGQKSYNGVAILAREKPRDVRSRIVRWRRGSSGTRYRGDRR